jgi:glycolate oxidase
VLYDERDPEQVKKAIHAGEDILAKCIELGGSVTGEHGIGIEKVDFMARQFSPADLEAMQKLRLVFDPGMRCNPHKMFPGGKRCGDFAPRKQIAA